MTTLHEVFDFQNDPVKHGDRVLMAYAQGVLREGLVTGTRADGRIVVQFGVVESDCLIHASGCLRIP